MLNASSPADYRKNISAMGGARTGFSSSAAHALGVQIQVHQDCSNIMSCNRSQQSTVKLFIKSDGVRVRNGGVGKICAELTDGQWSMVNAGAINTWRPKFFHKNTVII